MNKLLEYSKQIKSDAEQLLKTTNLVNILSKYGEVIIGGSYKYDLMWGPDIDIDVICKDTRSASVSALSELINLRLFQKYEYGDFVKFPREYRQKSYIMPLILPFNGQKWEIEVWFFNEYPENQKNMDELIESEMTDAKKLIILDAKSHRQNDKSTKHDISSVDIYKQVLINNATDYENICKNI